jgi:hypothetical protein
LNELQARTVLWIKAIEENDPHGVVLTRAQRAQAGKEARAGEKEIETAEDWTPAKEQFVVRRAENLEEVLRREFPGLDEETGRARWRTGWLLLLLAVAFVAGLAANHFGPERRISILAFPLLGVLVWNLAVYAGLLIRAIAALARQDSNVLFPQFLTRLLYKFSWRKVDSLPGREQGKSGVLSAGLEQFKREWRKAALPIYGVRFRLALHLGSAFVALGILAGMYVRGLAYEYQAGWESTFLDAEGVRRLLTIVLGPASVLTGMPIPGVDQIAQMRWREGQPGENAAPWIHLYAVTALLVVFIPRLALALSAFIRLKLLESRFPLERFERSPYFQRLSAQHPGAGASVLVAPYNYSMEGRGNEALTGLLRDCFGWSTPVEVRSSTAYGGEDSLLEELRQIEPAPDYLVALFNLAATPEEENHGRLMGGMRELIQEGKGGRRLLILVNTSPYRARFSAQEFFEKRMAERVKAWRRLAENHGLPVLAIDLDDLPLDFSCDLLQQAAWSATPAPA